MQWTEAIAHWLQQQNGKVVSLYQLQQALGILLMEVWLGLLLSKQQYDWEQDGDFYNEAQEIELWYR